MKKLLLILAMLGLTFCNCNAAWDNTTNFQNVAPAAAIQKIQDNFTACGGTAGGVLLPTGAAFYMFSGSCPTGTTDVTSTYSNKFIRINATQLSTGGADTHTHGAGSYAAAHSHVLASGSSDLPVGGAYSATTTTATATVTGTSASGDNVPAYITAKLCQVN